MGEGYIVRRGGIGSGGGLPEFTYSDKEPGAYEIFKEDAKNWRIEFYRSGTLTFTKLGSAANGIDAFILGGGGAGVDIDSTGAGGGGYYTVLSSKIVAKDHAYQINIGAGGNTVGSSGGDTIFDSHNAKGGGAPKPSYAKCLVNQNVGSNVQYYADDTTSAYVSIGNGAQTIYLDYDEKGQFITSNGRYKGSHGGDNVYWTFNGELVVQFRYYTPGEGAIQTTIFNTSTTVSGLGETENATRYGQGGGTSGIQGGNGLVVIRNSPIIINTQPANATVAENKNAIFTFKVAGRNLTYQWQFLPTGTGAQWSNTTAAGATTNQLTVQALSYRNGYKYRCIVSDGYDNQVISRETTLTISA